MMVLMLITLFHSYQSDLFTVNTKNFAKILGLFSLFLITFYLGTRPVSYQFGDMLTYSKFYNRIVAGETPIVTKDFLFNYFLIFCAHIIGERIFFFICAVIYIIPCYVFSKKYCGSYWYFVFFIFIGSYMFWPFGTNGIRNGLGTSIFILALCFYNRKVVMYILMAVSFGVHSSLIIPIAAFFVAGVYKNPKVYLYIWAAAIPLSLVGGGFWETLFASIGFGSDSRAVDYLTKGNAYHDHFAYTGFRWDFLFYSSFAVFAGWYFIFKKNITDKFYIHLWGIYMIANAFWILVIRANFSNRFAYLSWFLMAPIIAYPLLRYKMFPNQYRIIGIVLVVYYMFTYFMYLKG
ncbi:EpsG family protein [Halpernia humi]|uniref:EpsG family protein n=2 Tax=Halpernia humi TaxID=493375 RepID=A0A1H6ANU0_9FLAO|nr:EpsG family protein [Halpernia humi]